MPLFDHFGILAPIYDLAIPLKNANRLIELIGLPTPGLLLDAGGGTGRVAHNLLGLAEEIIVADISFEMLSQAAKKGGILSVSSHTEKLPFPDETFQRVIMVDALHHVCDHEETAAEMWRVLQPGGRIVIEEPDVRTLGVKLVALAEKLALMRSHFINPNRITGLFRQPNARSRIELDGNNAWVIVDKLLDGN